MNCLHQLDCNVFIQPRFGLLASALIFSEWKEQPRVLSVENKFTQVVEKGQRKLLHFKRIIKILSWIVFTIDKQQELTDGEHVIWGHGKIMETRKWTFQNPVILSLFIIYLRHAVLQACYIKLKKNSQWSYWEQELLLFGGRCTAWCMMLALSTNKQVFIGFHLDKCIMAKSSKNLKDTLKGSSTASEYQK